jgi:hypothetical protein
MSLVEFSRELIHKAETMGGTDYPDWHKYSNSDSVHYSNKPDHIERSSSNSNQHRKHFQKMDLKSIT